MSKKRKKITNSTLIRIATKWAETGEISSKDAVRGGLLLYDMLSRSEKTKVKARKVFSKSTKKLALQKQNNRCNRCRKKLKVYDFDHINETSSDNSPENCQALCPDCHAKKTRNKKISLAEKLKKLFLDSLQV